MRPADVPALASTLAHAFHHNPGMSWAYRGESTRFERLSRGFALYLQRLWLPNGECVTTEGLAGAALWMPPGAWNPPLPARLRLLPRILATARTDTARVLRFFAIAEKKHPHEPHWYLAVLGVDPSQQGRGYGSHLMAPVLRALRRRAPARLPRDGHGAQRGPVRAPRLPGHGGVPATRWRAAAVAHVARSGLVGLQRMRMKRRN